MDADEGGTKHIYDFIVAQMVKRDLRDRKLI
jgi:hypothetical protein